MKIMSANRIAPDGTLCFAASHLGLFCLPMSHKKDARLIWVNEIIFTITVKDEVYVPPPPLKGILLFMLDLSVGLL